MSKTLALVCLTLLWFAYLLLTGILLFPYGMAEPGQPKNTPAVLLMWPPVELAWAWVAFARRPRKALEGFFRVVRPPALFTIAIAAFAGGTAGLWMVSNAFYVAAPITSAGITTTGCWMARLHLRGADVDHRM
jgi:hypothetical protein